MKLGIATETAAGETRVAITPQTVKLLSKRQHQVLVESGAGLGSSIADEAYREAGASVVSRAEALAAQMVLAVRAPDAETINLMAPGSALVGMLEPHSEQQVALYRQKSLQAFALELLPRTSRAQSMDVLSSQANLAGYKAVLLAAHHCKRIFPMLMTSAGTIKAARVLILGIGVAGLQAIATARRLGAVVEAFDVRAETREQAESLGAKFIAVEPDSSEKVEHQGGYAGQMSEAFLERQRALIAERAAAADVVITTALIGGRIAPLLLSMEAVAGMKHGAVVVDMGAGKGDNGAGNCPVTQTDKVLRTSHGVTVIGLSNLPSLLATDASSLLAKNYQQFVDVMFDAEGHISLADELVKACLVG